MALVEVDTETFVEEVLGIAGELCHDHDWKMHRSGSYELPCSVDMHFEDALCKALEELADAAMVQRQDEQEVTG